MATKPCLHVPHLHTFQTSVRNSGISHDFRLPIILFYVSFLVTVIPGMELKPPLGPQLIHRPQVSLQPPGDLSPGASEHKRVV